MKLKLFYIILLCTLVCFIPELSFAQGDLPEETNDVPIDGGLSILLAAGVAYGAKKVHDSRKKNTAKDENPDTEK